MKLIDSFLAEIDEKWKPAGGEPIRLRVIGSAALMLQSDYARGTKDGDILQAEEITPAVREQLLALAGPRSPLYDKYGMYIELVLKGILFWPLKPVFHPLKDLRLKNIAVEVLDVTDVVVSKIKRLNQNDVDDIRAMAGKGLLDHQRLARRFQSAVDRFETDARAEDLPAYIQNLNRIEPEILNAPGSRIDLPGWMQ